MSAGQLVGAPGNLDLARYHAAKRRIKKTALPHLGQVQQLPGGVQQMTVRNPALQAVCSPGLDDLPRLAYAIAAGVGYVQIPALQGLGQGLPTQAGEPCGPAVQNGYIDPTAFNPAHMLRRAPGQQHDRREPAAGQLDSGHAGH